VQRAQRLKNNPDDYKEAWRSVASLKVKFLWKTLFSGICCGLSPALQRQKGAI